MILHWFRHYREFRASCSDTYSSVSLMRRVLREDGSRHWRSYASAAMLMAIAAGCTAISAYLVGHVINRAYMSRDLAAVIAFCIVIFAVFAVKGLAVYGQTIVLARISSALSAGKQQLMFDKR